MFASPLLMNSGNFPVATPGDVIIAQNIGYPSNPPTTSLIQEIRVNYNGKFRVKSTSDCDGASGSFSLFFIGRNGVQYSGIYSTNVGHTLENTSDDLDFVKGDLVQLYSQGVNSRTGSLKVCAANAQPGGATVTL